MPLRVPQTPLPPKRSEVRGPAYDMAAQATPSGRMWMFLSGERAAQCVCVKMWVVVEFVYGVEARRLHRAVQLVPSNSATFSSTSIGTKEQSSHA